MIGFKSFCQEIEKPSYVIVANNEIISEEKLGELMQSGLVKSMNKGVSLDVRNNFAEKFGDRIGEKEFISVLLFSGFRL